MIKKYIERYLNTAKNMSLYLLASMIPMLVQLAINPLIAKNMSPTDYAIRGYYTSYNTLFTPIVIFYLTSFYTISYFKLEKSERKELKATIFKILTTFSFIISAILLLLLYIYTIYFNKGSQLPFSPYAALAIFSLPFTGIFTLTLVEYRMQRESKKYFLLCLFQGLVVSSLLLLSVVIYKHGALGALGSVFACNLIFWIVCIYLNNDIITTKFNKKIFKDSLVFCLPLVLAAMFSFFTNGYDKVLLERLSDVEILGIYSVGAGIAGYLGVFATSINDTFQPDIFKAVAEKNYRITAKYIILKVSLISIVVLFFIIFAPFLIKILTAGRYVASTKFAIIISLSSISSMIYHSVHGVVIANGHTYLSMINNIIGGIISVFLYYILIDNFGASGAAWGVVLSWFIFALGLLVLVFFNSKCKGKPLNN